MDKKICGTCNQELDIVDFSLKDAKTNKRHSKCKACQKEYSKKHYTEKKVDYLDKAKVNNKKYKKRNDELLVGLKEGKPCKDCGECYPHYVMDFDHLPNFQKSENVSKMKNSSFSAKAIIEEIKKCELVCANCHRERTWKRLH